MRTLAIVALCCLLAACDYRARAVTGTVFEITNVQAPSDEWQLTPVQGAEIAVYWQGYKPLYSHGGRGYCLAIEHTTSDSEGRFHVEGRTVPRAVGGITDIDAVSAVYVPGYAQLKRHEHKSSIWGDPPIKNPHVHLFQRVADPGKQDARADVFYHVQFCPSVDFQR